MRNNRFWLDIRTYSPYDGRMRNETNTQIFPTKRTDATYRAVLQRFDAAAGRYRTLESARIETPPGADPDSVRMAWGGALTNAFGAGAAAGVVPDVVPIDDGAPLGSGLKLSDIDSDI